MKYNKIKIGNIYSFKRKISKEDVLNFSELTGDTNPLHIDEGFGRKSVFNKNICHGMLGASLFSTLVGVYCPGKNALYLSQTINFKLPIFYNDEIEVRGEVMEKNDSIKMITVKTEIINNKKIAICGIAKIKVIENE